MVDWLKAKYKMLIVIGSIVLAIMIAIILFNNIPRLTYEYSDTYEGYIVSKAYGNSESYTIPEEYKGKPVVGFGIRAFFRHDKLEKVNIKNPQNIKYVGKLSFSECPKLKAIDISYADKIERNAFSYDKSLNNLTVSAKDIGSSAFYKCSSLENIIIEDGVETIGSMAFSHTSINKIELPKSISVIHTDCFLYIDNLEEIVVYGKNDMLDTFRLNNEYLFSLGDIVKFKE
ncbi:MAG: leucine-rich repeat domain-containing protein [Acholeplasmatales bacterium]|nr:leucine-rich repeat domain-containing protein [Acholeplasmatales bacterium]